MRRSASMTGCACSTRTATVPDVNPHPKAAQLARGTRKYRRVVAGAKQWQRIAADKTGPCRVCSEPANNGRLYGHIELHHLVPRSSPWFGDDVADNIVPLCPDCHAEVTAGNQATIALLRASLSEAEALYVHTKRGRL